MFHLFSDVLWTPIPHNQLLLFIIHYLEDFRAHERKVSSYWLVIFSEVIAACYNSSPYPCFSATCLSIDPRKGRLSSWCTADYYRGSQSWLFSGKNLVLLYFLTGIRVDSLPQEVQVCHSFLLSGPTGHEIEHALPVATHTRHVCTSHICGCMYVMQTRCALSWTSAALVALFCSPFLLSTLAVS